MPFTPQRAPRDRLRGIGRRAAIAPLLGGLALTAISWSASGRGDVPESEPNGGIAVADSLRVGDVAVGAIDPRLDVDTYGLDLFAGSVLQLDFAAQGFGARLSVRSADGALIADNIEVTADGETARPRLDVVIDATGRYFVSVSYFSRFPIHDNDPTPHLTYRLPVTASGPGPGDPTVLLSSVDDPIAMVAGHAGELYVLTAYGILRIPNGSESGSYFSPETGADLALDGFGDLLVSQRFAKRIARISTTTAAVSTFATLDLTPGSLAVGPGGDVWVVGDFSHFAQLYEFDALGTLRRTMPGFQSNIPHTAELAFSPAGVLYLVSGYTTARLLDDGGFQVWGSAPNPFIALAFDSSGASYAATAEAGIDKRDAAFDVEYAPFAATNLSGATAITFMRDASGSMTRRIVVARRFCTGLCYGELVLIDSSAVVAPGALVAADFRTAAGDLRPAQVGVAYDDTVGIGIPATWTTVGGAWPPGFTLAGSGRLSGTTTAGGEFSATVRASFANGRTLTSTIPFRVLPSTEAAAQQLLGAERFTPEIELMLDAHGNQNGAYDAGDLRALIAATEPVSW